MRSRLSLLLFVTLLLIYNAFFWGEKLGLNLMLFSLMLTGIIVWLNPWCLWSRGFLATAAGTLLSGASVAVHNTDAGKAVHISSFFLMVAFAHQSALKSVLYAVPTVIQTYLRAPLAVLRDILALQPTRFNSRKTLSLLRLTVAPVTVLMVFFWIYRAANPVFDALSADALEHIASFLNDFLYSVSLDQMRFLLLGAFILGGALYNQHINIYTAREAAEPDRLSRAGLRAMFKARWTDLRFAALRQKSVARPFSFSAAALRYEHYSGLLLLILLNLLLLVVNAIDVRWIWFEFTLTPDFNLKQFVHEGTYLLILSILLSMAVMLYLFRGNQNFYPQNRWLQYGAALWIFQNAVLAASVGMRNFYYIFYQGLAYKRIGVYFFLALTLFGLATLYRKIQEKHSLPYLVRLNGWAVYAVMILIALIDWDVWIVSHNLSMTVSGRHSADIAFLSTRSDSTLPVFSQYRQTLARTLLPDVYQDLMIKLEVRREFFLAEQRRYSALSWNYADAKTQDYLSAHTFPLTP